MRYAQKTDFLKVIFKNYPFSRKVINFGYMGKKRLFDIWTKYSFFQRDLKKNIMNFDIFGDTFFSMLIWTRLFFQNNFLNETKGNPDRHQGN